MNIPILMYHSIMDGHDKSVSIKSFQRQMNLMKGLGYISINFSEIDNENLKKKFIITFDDGYENIHTNAFPILKKLDFKATCFIISGKINQYNDWDKDKKNFKKLQLMNYDQIKELSSNGFEIGSHTKDHVNLTSLSTNEKNEQIISSKNFIKDQFNIDVKTFAYPFGSYDDESIRIVKDHYNYAVTTKPSKFNPNKFKDIEIPRVSINSNTSAFKFLLKVMTNYENFK